jgi:hypothetical protein
MTAREFLDYAGMEENRRNFSLLSIYVSSSIDYADFPDADLVIPLAKYTDEPAAFQEYAEQYLEEHDIYRD